MALRPFLPLVFFKEKNKKDSLFHDDNLIASILDLVMAGTETIATTLQWSILLMMKYPEIQSELLSPILCLWHGRYGKGRGRDADPQELFCLKNHLSIIMNS